MNQPKPIEKWKFDLQIAIAILAVVIYCTRAVLFILFDIENTTMNNVNSSLWYVTTLLGFIMSGFLIMLFRSVPVIKNLSIILIILNAITVTVVLIHRFFIYDIELSRIANILYEVLDLGSLILALILNINMLRKKFDNIPQVKMLRSYAIACICIIVIIFLLPLAMFIIPLNPQIMNWEMGLNYFLLAVPDVFLVGAYINLRSRIRELV